MRATFTQLRGVLAQEDLLREAGRGARLRQLLPGAAGATGAAAARWGCHHVAITGKDGAMVGLVSQSDLLYEREGSRAVRRPAHPASV